jgi:hypothetical protein
MSIGRWNLMPEAEKVSMERIRTDGRFWMKERD